MPRLYGYNETLVALMPYAVEDTEMCVGEAVPGFVAGQVLPNPYQAADGSHSPIGQVLCSLGVDTDWLENVPAKHVRLCDDSECEICEEGADNSIYTQWVRQWLSDEYDMAFTEEALDILWEAETSGLTLGGWLEEQELRKQAGWLDT